MKTFANLFFFLFSLSLSAQEYYDYAADSVSMEMEVGIEMVQPAAASYLASEAHLPDLEAYFYAPFQSASKTLAFDIPVMNKGGQASKASILQFSYNWQTASGQKKTFRQEIEVPAIAAGKMHTLRVLVKDRAFQKDFFAHQTGAYTMLVLDPYNVVSERNEANNSLRSTGNYTTTPVESNMETNTEEGMIVEGY